ncbi:hypothetical protein [Succinimonas sp.]|uniref:hypothetical protein n=1 Tax=Succinimonas sp. TaxID=1936151 RepID=UPI00386FE8DA
MTKDNFPSPLSMPFDEWVKLLPKVKLSEMTCTEKLSFIRNACYGINDMTSGQCRDEMNDEWYGKVLAVIKDCGFDASAIEIIDWNSIKDVADNCDEICYKLKISLIQFIKANGAGIFLRNRSFCNNRISINSLSIRKSIKSSLGRKLMKCSMKKIRCSGSLRLWKFLIWFLPLYLQHRI